MRIKVYIFVVLPLALFMPPVGTKAQPDSAAKREYQIKAAFLYNFLKFVDWPEEKIADSNEPMMIGIIGKDPFDKAFEPVKDKKVNDREVVVKRFSGFAELKKSGENGSPELQRQIKALQKCHLLFICSSEEKELKEIINLVKDHRVLTVADLRGFLESGGIVNFLMEEKKVGFEINIAAAKQAKLKIRSQLLRLAKRVITEDDVGNASQSQGASHVYYAKYDNKE